MPQKSEIFSDRQMTIIRFAVTMVWKCEHGL